MADPLAWALAAAGRVAEKVGAIVIGLAIGTLAKYGLALNEGRKLTRQAVLGDLLLQGVLGCIALAISNVLGLAGDARVFVAALVAMNSDRMVRLARDTFFRSAEQRSSAVLGQTLKAAPAIVAEVPAGPGEPEALLVQRPVGDQPAARIGAALRKAMPVEDAPADLKDVLKQLGDSEL